MLAGNTRGGFTVQRHIHKVVGHLDGGRLPMCLPLELGLKGNKNICKGGVHSNFVVFLPIKPLSIVPSAMLLSVEGGR